MEYLESADFPDALCKRLVTSDPLFIHSQNYVDTKMRHSNNLDILTSKLKVRNISSSNFFAWIMIKIHEFSDEFSVNIETSKEKLGDGV